MLGRLLSDTELDPKAAVFLQNKDEIVLDLLTETIPTPAAFRDSIASLSPEQARFAKAYRALQLEGSVFGIAVVQVYL